MTEQEFKNFENKCEFIEKELRSLPPISFNMRRAIHINNKTNLKDWTELLINTYCLFLDTYEMGRDELGIVVAKKVCDKEKHRSADDLYRITIFYKPTIKFIEFIEVLFTLGIEDKIRSLYCNDIKKRTYYPRIDTFYGSDFPKLAYYGCEYTDKREEYNFDFRLLIKYYEEKTKIAEGISTEGQK